MMPIPPGEPCAAQLCAELATGYHPYIGFCCRAHQQSCQEAYNQSGRPGYYESFSVALAKLKRQTNQGKYR